MTDQQPVSKAWMASILGVGMVFGAALLLEANHVNGPPYWRWRWRDLDIVRAALLMGIPQIALMLVVWRLRRSIDHRKARPVLAALVVTSYAMQFAAILLEPASLSQIRTIIVSPVATNFYTEAVKIQSLPDWLAAFHTRPWHVHTGTHPPGPVLYFLALIRLLGADLAAVVGGAGIGLMGSLGVLVLYQFAGLWTSDTRARLIACALYSTLPALIVFFPFFDQVYPSVSMLLAISWVRSLRDDLRCSALFGGVLFLASLFAYGLLTMGAFCGLWAAYHIARATSRRPAWLRVAQASALGLGTFFLLHALLRATLGYDAWGSLRNAQAHQARVDPFSLYPYHFTLLFAPYDFLLGAGMIVAPVVAGHLRRTFGSLRAGEDGAVLSWVGMATILIVALSHLLPSETARLWLFLQPFIVVPAALELARFGGGQMSLFFSLQWLVLIILKCKLVFIAP